MNLSSDHLGVELFSISLSSKDFESFLKSCPSIEALLEYENILDFIISGSPKLNE